VLLITQVGCAWFEAPGLAEDCCLRPRSCFSIKVALAQKITGKATISPPVAQSACEPAAVKATTMHYSVQSVLAPSVLS
jgi:hypothetical protein